MSVRRRARAQRRRLRSGWVSDAAGPAVHMHAEREPSDQAVVAVLQLRDVVIAAWRRAELEAGRWEDDGGPSEPEGVHRTYSLLTGRQAGRSGALSDS